MHAQPQRTLKRLLKQYGQELIDDPRRTEALLRDLCGQYTREIFVLVNAQKQRVPNELRAAPAWMPRQATYSRLSRLLQNKLAITEDAADWAVAAWAAALDLDAPAKGESWSWLPAPLRAPAPPRTRKSRKRKRQNSSAGVQSGIQSKENVRQARNRAARAEMGWRFPGAHLLWPTFLSNMPSIWANLLPWIALVAATIFLLIVVYWTSSARSQPVVATDPSAGVTPVSESGTDAMRTPATDGLQMRLDGSPSDYLAEVMPLPAVAHVDAVTLYIREQPTTDSVSLGFLGDGEAVHVIAFSQDGEWSQIDQPSSGWVSNDYLLFNSQNAPISVRIDLHPRRTKSYEVAVRTAPHANGEVITTLQPDYGVVVATVMGEPASWYQIADPAVGWVAAADLVPATP